MPDFAIDPNGPLGYLVQPTTPKAPDNALGKDAFLKLLVAQMKYQNPMDPSDSTEFISQTAQFTLVEKMDNMEKSSAQLLATNQSLAASTLVGRWVTWKPDTPTATADDPTPVDTISGMVTGVKLVASGPVLLVGDMEVPMSSVTELGLPPDVPADAAPPASAPPAGGAPAPSDDPTNGDDPSDPTAIPAA